MEKTPRETHFQMPVPPAGPTVFFDITPKCWPLATLHKMSSWVFQAPSYPSSNYQPKKRGCSCRFATCL